MKQNSQFKANLGYVVILYLGGWRKVKECLTIIFYCREFKREAENVGTLLYSQHLVDGGSMRNLRPARAL